MEVFDLECIENRRQVITFRRVAQRITCQSSFLGAQCRTEIFLPGIEDERVLDGG
jgi:hypothetical protein